MTWAERFDRIFIDARSTDSRLAHRVRSLLPAEKIEIVDQRPFPASRGELSAAEFDRSKRNLFLTPFSGQFFKRCPGSHPGLFCCNYFVLNWGLQCDMNCSYCYLQSFINTPVMTLYTNLASAFEELRALYKTLGHQKVRIGTGETVDSLSLDPLTGFAAETITAFRNFPQWTVEFKTKSACVDQFLDVPHAGNAVISWSVNPQELISSEEHLTASLEARLSAADRCVTAGFQIAFHIDPMIWHPEWQKNYDTLVDAISQRFSPESVNVISVGALRFQPEQRHMMRERFGLTSWVTRAEMHPSRDGKWRYNTGLRTKMFERVRNRFLAHSPHWKIFFCMETPEIWASTTEDSPFKRQELKEFFDPRVAQAVQSSAK